MRFQNQMKSEAAGAKIVMTTTLYDLIAALNHDVDQDEDELITAAVVYLIRAGRLTFLGDITSQQLVWA